MKIGLKIKTLRKQQQMTLEQLAQKSRLSPGVLSQLERNISTPRVTTLQKISKAFDVTMSSLFSDDHVSMDGREDRKKKSQDPGFIAVVRKQQRKKIYMPWGATMEMLCPDLHHKVEFMYFIYPPGTKVEEQYAHEGEECGMILEGTFAGVVGDQEIILEAGDSVYFDSAVPHRWENIGDKEVRAVWVVTPPWL